MTTILRIPALSGLLAMIAAAVPAAARPVAAVRVVTCAAGDCLLIRGHRASATAMVQVNERPIEVRGGTSWRVRLPVATVRDWSAPFARTLRIAVVDAAGRIDRDEAVRLPVGLLGGELELASLMVHAR